MALSRLPEDQPRPVRLIDQTPASYIEGQVAQLCEHNEGYDRMMGLHLETTSLAQVIADDIVAGETPWPPTVAKYQYARDEYRLCIVAREQSR